MPTLNQGCQAIKPTAGTELQDRLQYTLSRIADIRAVARDKLEKVATPEVSAPTEAENIKSPTYPQYFEAAFDKLNEMDSILQDLHDLILRVDL